MACCCSNSLSGEMCFDCWLCSDLCISSFSLLVCLVSPHSGPRGYKSRLHLPTTHKAGALEPTGGIEITLTQFELRGDLQLTILKKKRRILLFSWFISSMCQFDSLLFTGVSWRLSATHTSFQRPIAGTSQGHYWADDVKHPVADGLTSLAN